MSSLERSFSEPDLGKLGRTGKNLENDLEKDKNIFDIFTALGEEDIDPFVFGCCDEVNNVVFPKDGEMLHPILSSDVPQRLISTSPEKLRLRKSLQQKKMELEEAKRDILVIRNNYEDILDHSKRVESENSRLRSLVHMSPRKKCGEFRQRRCSLQLQGQLLDREGMKYMFRKLFKSTFEKQSSLSSPKKKRNRIKLSEGNFERNRYERRGGVYIKSVQRIKLKTILSRTKELKKVINCQRSEWNKLYTQITKSITEAMNSIKEKQEFTLEQSRKKYEAWICKLLIDLDVNSIYYRSSNNNNRIQHHEEEEDELGQGRDGREDIPIPTRKVGMARVFLIDLHEEEEEREVWLECEARYKSLYLFDSKDWNRLLMPYLIQKGTMLTVSKVCLKFSLGNDVEVLRLVFESIEVQKSWELYFRSNFPDLNIK